MRGVKGVASREMQFLRLTVLMKTAQRPEMPMQNWPTTSTLYARKWRKRKMAINPDGTIPKSGDAATTPSSV